MATKKHNLGWILLPLMVAQNSSTVLVARYTRNVPPEDRYVVHHMVVLTEVLKLILSCALEHMHSDSLFQSLKHHVLERPWSGLKMAMPALLYLVQNTLVYMSISYVSAPLFQVTYQSKLVTTALLSVLLLNRKYIIKQWLCILAVSVGVAIVVVLGDDGAEKSDTTTTTTESKEANLSLPSTVLFGVGLIGISCLCSSLAGVYFEKVIKTNAPNDDEPQVSLWMRNIQLSFFTLCIAAVQDVIMSDVNKDFFYGFTPWVWLQIFLLGGGGLLVAAVIKYTDSVVKGLATGVSVVVSTAASNLLWGTPFTLPFVAGGSLIVGGGYFFSNPVCPSVKQVSTRQYLLLGMLAAAGTVLLSLASQTFALHKQTPELMEAMNNEAMNNETRRKALSYAFPPRTNPSQHLPLPNREKKESKL